MFGLEPWHIVLLLAVVLVVVGPKRLPEIGKNLGESIREFRKATSEFGGSVRSASAAPSDDARLIHDPAPLVSPSAASVAPSALAGSAPRGPDSGDGGPG
jgi:TatA/E family protein of Tat protein translocase